MNAQIEPRAETTLGSVTTYSCTFGYYTQTGPWTDVRALAWPDLAALLTQHGIGAKEGTCIVPATFSSPRRHKANAQRIDVAFLDSDAGTTLQEITDAIEVWSWAAVVSSTHSHLTTTTRAKRCNWDRFRVGATDATAAPAAFLVIEKGYLPRIAAEAAVVQQDEEYVTFKHQPCPKFRVALPLLRPWMARGYGDQRQADAAWKERIEALAATLSLSHDQACTDTSRLFYLPRRPADGPAAEIRVLEGVLCDIFALPSAPCPKPTQAKPSRPGKDRRRLRESVDTDPHMAAFVDPETGEVADLVVWAATTASQFEIVKALRARRPDLFVGKVTDGTKHHIRCTNEDRHTDAGPDAATMIINASDSANDGFVYHCRHAHCDGVDRLVFLRRMLVPCVIHIAG